MPERITKASSPATNEKFTLRILILFGILLMIVFVIWFADPYHIGHPLLFWLLTTAFAFRFFRMLHEWYHYFNLSVAPEPVLRHDFKVDVLTTSCPGEPHSMIIKTLKSIRKLEYPHTAYLCDEGDDPVLKKVCLELGVIHVTRTDKTNAKAGNINNALRQATGDICLILDPDHIPHPKFLNRVLPFFENPETGFVQVVQAYYNRKESMVANAAAEQTYHFYGPMMMSMNYYGTAQAIGANCTFRRKALDSIGGHAPGLAEDMNTSLLLHAKGWKSVYVPEVLSKGLVPAGLASYYKQQLKWSRGTFEILFTTFPQVFRNLNWKQKLHYGSVPLYYLFGLINLIELLIPALSIILAVFPWNVRLAEFCIYYLPLLFTSLAIRSYSQRWLLEPHEKGIHLSGGILRTATWWIYLLGFFYSLIRKKIPYIPTPKEDKPENYFWLSLPNLIAIGFCLGAIFYNRLEYGHSYFTYPYNLLMVAFVLVNCFILGTGVLLGQQKLVLQVLNWLKLKRERIATFTSIKYAIRGLEAGFLMNLRKYPVYIAGAVTLIASGSAVMTYNQNHNIQVLKPVSIRNREAFYLGAYSPKLTPENAAPELNELKKLLDNKMSLVSVYQAWGSLPEHQFPGDFVYQMHKQNTRVMITWEPWTSTFGEFEGDTLLSGNKKILEAILAGKFDFFLEQYARDAHFMPGEIFIRFAHEPENPQYPWYGDSKDHHELYVKAYRHVVDVFHREKADNIRWVWTPWKDLTMEAYYPGNDYVDIIGINLLNYGQAASDGLWHSFATLYEPFRFRISRSRKEGIQNKPVMISEFGSTRLGGNQSEWMEEALFRIAEMYSEIKYLVFFESGTDKNWPGEWRPDSGDTLLDWRIADQPATRKVVKDFLGKPPYSNFSLAENK